MGDGAALASARNQRPFLTAVRFCKIEMTPERWQLVKDTLARALEYSAEDARSAFLQDACANDSALRREVQSLLDQSDQDDFDLCADSVGLTSAGTVPDSNEGRRVGAYELVRELGRGGMGTVWLARRADQQFEKLVAIKLLKRGTDTEEVLRRFESERRMLATLQHPNIASLFDGGTTDGGLPYFVMEYVVGVPVTTYCSENKLSVEQRLRLFVKICAAVQFAHQHLIVHRDLKPANILVTADCEPKLLDFGIAKLLADDRDSFQVTLFDHQRLTPAYASPEQVRGDPITTVSDIYSLGVILYELLSGKNAHRFSTARPAPTELLRVVAQEEPLRPSAATSDVSIRRRLQGDLDNIVLKALRKDPERRYGGLGSFAEDIRRHLENLPVIARKDTFAYRAGKFLQRNKFGVAAAVLIMITALVGFISTIWKAHEARIERARAELRFDDVRTLASSLLSELNDEAAKLSGSTNLRSILVKRTLGYLDKVSQESARNLLLQRELANAYQKVGDIQGNTYFSNLGDLNGAIDSYRKCLAIREELSRLQPQNTETRLELALAHEGYADVLWGGDHLPETAENYRAAQVILEELMRVDPASKQIRIELAQLYHKIGDLQGDSEYSNLGDTAGAVESKRKALKLREELVKEEPSNKTLRDALSESYFNLGKMQRITGDLPSALKNYRNTLAVQKEFAAADPTSQLFRNHTMFVRRYMAMALQENGDIHEARDNQRIVVQIAEQEAAADQKDNKAQRSLGVSYVGMADLLTKSGDVGSGLDYYRKGIVVLERLLAATPGHAEVQRDLLVAYLGIGDAELTAGNQKEAIEYYSKAKPAAEALATADGHNTQARGDVAALHLSLAALAVARREFPSALENCRKAVTIREELSSASPTNALMRRDLALAYASLADAYKQRALQGDMTRSESLDNFKAAREWYDKSLAIWREMESKGTLPGSYTGKPEQISREIAQCDVGLN
jgi:serine/threonine protein kinase